jgi:Ca2+-transporting ATPase
MEDAHSLDVHELINALKTDPKSGLSSQAAMERLVNHGPNELVSATSSNGFRQVAEQLSNPLMLLLVAAALISLLFGQLENALSISVVIPSY